MKIAVLGCGVVGSGVVELCRNRKDLSVVKILDLREFPGLDIPVTKDFNEILNDPEIDIVVETMGGVHPAGDFALAALKAGKHLVSSNKAMAAAYYEELFETVKQNGLALRYTAAAGGGIPWLYELGRIASVCPIQSVSGIMNGTTNFILDHMTKDGAEFGTVLAEAQRLGYAEANPAADIDGLDIRRKLVLSSNIAYGVSLKEESVPAYGIRNITQGDIAAFTDAGLVCRMIGKSVPSDEGIIASVTPVLFPKTAPEAAVGECFNRFTLTAQGIGTRAFYGEGAGSLATAANIVRDCLDIMSGFRGFYTDSVQPAEVSKAGQKHSWYVRGAENVPCARVMGAGVVTQPMTLAELEPLLNEGCFFAQVFDN